MNLLKSAWILLLVSLATILNAQPKKNLIEIAVTPNHTNWTYNLGEVPVFNIQVLQNGQPLSNSKINYKIGLEQLPAALEKELDLKDGTTSIKAFGLKEPGFLRCEVSTEVNGKTYKAWGTAAFEPEKIQPFVKMPTDFDQFWNNAKTELSKIPMDAVVTLQSDQCTADYNVYHVCLKNINMPEAWRGKSSVYGMVSIPKKPGKYPAILGVPGAGIRSYHGDGRAAKGAIVFNIGIHGIPVNMPDENYSVLANGALSDYWTLHLEDRDKYYYKRVFLGCVRAIDYIFSLPEFDGKNLAVNGGSQGGALSIICAGLDKRITCLAAFYPAMCDMPGYLAKRAGGWPHMFRNWDKEVNPKWLETIAYFDVVNFARRVSQPGWYTWGYDDNVCPPTSMFAAYNSITAKKELTLFYETEHWNFPEQWEFSNTWMYQQLGISTEN